MTTDEIISRCYEHGQPDYILAADRLKQLRAECDAARDSAADARMLAFKWMERHDKISAGKDGGPFPKPADLPEAIARALAAEARLAEAMKVIEPFTNACLPFTLNGDCTMIPANAVEAARAFTNAAKEKT